MVSKLPWTFGMHIRAARMHYELLPFPEQTGLLRISDYPQGWLCELRPLGMVPNDLRDKREHYIWWENGHGKEVVASSPFLRCIRVVKAPLSVVIGEDGRPMAGER